MKAMLLAAGFGSRMRPLTNTVPKALLAVQGKPLIVYHLEALAAAGIDDIVINVCHLGHLIETALGSGSEWGVRIQYSREAEPLEAAGGIIQALPLLGAEPFVVVSADIYTAYDFGSLPKQLTGLAHLVLVDNPPHHLQGDMSLAEGRIGLEHPRLTYGAIGVFKPDLFAGEIPRKLGIMSVLTPAIMAGKVSGEYYQGRYINVGTPACLEQLNNMTILSSA